MRRIILGKLWRTFVVLAMLTMSLVSMPVALASTSVTIANGDVTSLTNAINTANSSGTPTIIDLASGGDYVLTTQYYDDDVNYSGLPEIKGNITLHGHGSTIERSSTAAVFGLLNVGPGGALSIDNVLLTGGNNTNLWYKDGGAIYNTGTLTVTNCTITGNAAPNSGGGIMNEYGTLTVIGSTITNNTSLSTAVNSAGGGIDNAGGTATIVNSTIAGNSAYYAGGGINNVEGFTTVIFSTVVGNSAIFGGGIDGIGSGNATVSNSIVANSSGANIYNFVVDGGHNDIGTDTHLGSLANNGGPTQTIALLAGSAAIDGADDMACASSPVGDLDQRGFVRPAGSHCDIGAFEYGAVGPVAPAFTFNLTGLTAKSFGDPSFSVASYATKPADDAGAITFALGSGSVGCSVDSGGTVTISGATGSGACIIEASLAASGSYAAAGPISQSFSIAKATPVITWNNPADIGYGTVLSTTQLNATASVPGTFTYTPPSGTLLNAGANQTLSVNFVPTDSTNYASTTSSVRINVAQASQTISFTSTAPSNAAYGDTYTPTATGGGSGNPVTFDASGACAFASGSVNMTGTGTCTVTADQAGNGNYAAATQAQQIFSVGPASASISLDAATLNPTYDGSPHTVTATTNPGGLSYSVTYDGSATAPTNAGSYTVVATIIDSNHSGSDSGTLVIVQATQSISFGPLSDRAVGDPSFSVSATGGVSGNPVTFSAGPSGVCSASGTNGGTISIDGAGSCTVTANQAGNTNYSAAPPVMQSFTISNPTSNVAPTVTISTPAIGTIVPAPYSATLTAPFTDTGDTGAHVCAVSWGDNGSTTFTVNPSNPSVCGATHSYAAAGVYSITVTVNDDGNLSDSTSTMLVVYDPSAGFVTGGGWFNSPAGAYTADPSMTGRATFGFVSKYQKGAKVPTGTTQFQFDAADFSFASDNYQWLVVNQDGTNAQFKGTGTINGTGSYTFMIWASDGSPDTFRIQITDNNNSDTLVYDNGPAQAIGGGQIVVHTSKK